MVAHLLRLRLAAQIAPLRTRTWPVAALALVATLAVTALACAGAIALRSAPDETARVAIVLGGALVAVGFFVAPFGSARSDQLDAAAFSLLPLSRISTAAATALAGIVSLPVIAVVAVDVAAATAGIAHGTQPWAAATGVAAHALTCGLLARLGYAVAVRVRVSGRTREGAAVALILAVAVAAPGIAYSVSQSWDLGAPALALAVADVAVLTPLGGASALLVPGPGIAPVIAGATVIVLFACWWLVVRHAFATPPTSVSQQSRGLGWLGLLPRTATGAIGARGMIYWARDTRYLANIAIIPVAGLVPVIPLLIAGVPMDIVALIPLPIIAAFLGWSVHNDLAYDSEAIWLHLVASVRGVADRVGRLVPITAVSIPILSVTIAITAAVTDSWEHLGALVGASLALTLSGFGLSSISSAAGAYAVARPGDSPFRQPQRAGNRGVVAPAVVLLATVAVSMPTLWAAFDVVSGGAPREREVLLTGAGTGLGVLVVGVAIGALVFERRGHRLVEVGQVR